MSSYYAPVARILLYGAGLALVGVAVAEPRFNYTRTQDRGLTFDVNVDSGECQRTQTIGGPVSPLLLKFEADWRVNGVVDEIDNFVNAAATQLSERSNDAITFVGSAALDWNVSGSPQAPTPDSDGMAMSYMLLPFELSELAPVELTYALGATFPGKTAEVALRDDLTDTLVRGFVAGDGSGLEAFDLAAGPYTLIVSVTAAEDLFDGSATGSLFAETSAALRIVPEPSTAACLLLAGLGWLRRR